MLGLVRLLLLTQLLHAVPLQKDSSSYIVGPPRDTPGTGSNPQNDIVGPSPSPTLPGSGPGTPSPSTPELQQEGLECNEVNTCFAGFVCDSTSGTGICRKAKNCSVITCADGTICQQLFGLDARCYGTNDCTITPCNPSQTCVTVGVPVPFCRNTLTCNDIPCDVKSNCRPGSQGVDAVCVPPCADNEHWDTCGGCDGSCGNPHIVCAALCNPAASACRCNTNLVRGLDGKCIDLAACPPGIPLPTPTNPTPGPTPAPSPTPTEPTPSVPPPPIACNLDCISGKHCVVTPSGPTCVDNVPQACNLDCKVGFHCVLLPSGPTCEPNAPHVCNIDCKIGTHCVVLPSGPTCVPNEPTPVPPGSPPPHPPGTENYYDQCKAQNCPEHLQCALLFDKRMYCNLDLKCACDCEPDQVCVLQDVICVRAPCNPVPHCYSPPGPTPVPTVPTIPPTSGPSVPPSPGPSPATPSPSPVPSVPPTTGPGNYHDQCKAQNCPEHLQCALLPDKRMYCNLDLKCECECEPDHVCVLEDVECVKAPCDPVPHCYSLTGEGKPPTIIMPSPPTPAPTGPPYPLQENYFRQCRALHCPYPQQCVLEQWLELHCGISPGVKCNCSPDQLCVLQVVTCIQAPCPPIPICYSNPGKHGDPSPPPPLPPPATPGPAPIAPIEYPANYYKQCKALHCPHKQQCILESWLELHCGIIPGTKCNCSPDQVCVIEVVVCCCPPCNPIATCYSRPEKYSLPGLPTPPEKICDKHCPSGTVCVFGNGDSMKCVQETSSASPTTQGTPTNPPCNLPCPSTQTCKRDANGDAYCEGPPPCVLPCPLGQICDLNSNGKPYCKSQCDPPCPISHMCIPGLEGSHICQPAQTPVSPLPLPSYGPCVPPLPPCAPGHTCQRNKDGSQICVEQCDPPCSENHVCRPGFEGFPICQPGFPTPTPTPTPKPTSPVPSYGPCVPPLPPCAPGHTCQRNKDGSQICVEQCDPPCSENHVCRPGFLGTPICQPGFPTPTPSPTPTPTSPLPSYGPCVPPLPPCAPGRTCRRNKDGSQSCVELCDPPCTENHVCRPAFEGTPVCAPSPTPPPTSPVPSYGPCVPPFPPCAPGFTCQRNKDGSQICVEQPCPLPCSPPSHVCVVTDSGPQCVEVPPPRDTPYI